MEFLLYLTPSSQEIYKMVSQRVKVNENAPICKKYEIFGWYQSTTNTLTFCTQAIKEFGQVSYYVNETLLHESVHVAQACKSNNGYVKPFWISLNSMPLSSRRKNDVSTASKVHGDGVKQIEHEAYWMEDKPDKVKYVLRKYCM
jgi:hypothetical protein